MPRELALDVFNSSEWNARTPAFLPVPPNSTHRLVSKLKRIHLSSRNRNFHISVSSNTGSGFGHEFGFARMV